MNLSKLETHDDLEIRRAIETLQSFPILLDSNYNNIEKFLFDELEFKQLEPNSKTKRKKFKNKE